MRSPRGARLLVVLSLAAPACVVRSDAPKGMASFSVAISAVKVPGMADQPLPDADHPLALDANAGTEILVADIAATDVDGKADTSYSGYVRLSIHPGTVTRVLGDGAAGRNVSLVNGVAKGVQIEVTGAHGPSRVWVEDLGYVPADPGKPPACSNGKDDDGDGLVDFPGDPGCAFANDDTEAGGSYATGVSPPVYYALPTVADARGHGAATPYPEESLSIAVDKPANVIVTRVSSDGFYVTDLNEKNGYASLFAFNFSTPPGLRVCDRVTYLAGTASEFFGFFELGFPTYDEHPWNFDPVAVGGDGPCLVPEPTDITALMLASPDSMERVESGLVRVQNVTIAKNFGPGLVKDGVKFSPEASNCDLNGDGKVDHSNDPEKTCGANCDGDPDCSEWTEFLAQSNYAVRVGNTAVLWVNTSNVVGFDPPSHRGTPILALSGTLRQFSGGVRNWTIETRCGDDFVHCEPGDAACLAHPPTPLSSQIACVRPRTTSDPGTN